MPLPLLRPSVLLGLSLFAVVAADDPPEPIWSPDWPVTYAMHDATFAFVDVNTSSAQFGAVVYGWAFDKATAPADAAELSKIASQCARNKRHNPRQRCFAYLNTELALGWYSEQYAVISNATLSEALLIKATDGSIIDASAGPTMIQKFWDFREPTVVEYWAENVLAPVLDPSSVLDGVLFDDIQGFPNEHAGVAEAFCDASTFDPKTQSCPEVDVVRAATHTALARLMRLIASRGKFSLAYEFGGYAGLAQNLSRFVFVSSPDGDHGTNACTAAVRDAMSVGAEDKPFVMTATSFNSTFHGDVTDPWLELRLATFLIARSRYALFGSSDVYDGSNIPNIDYPQLRKDYGEPLGFGREMAPGVFAREWTKASVSLDCNLFTTKIEDKSLKNAADTIFSLVPDSPLPNPLCQ